MAMFMGSNKEMLTCGSLPKSNYSCKVEEGNVV